jgi:hypothetical protein
MARRGEGCGSGIEIGMPTSEPLPATVGPGAAAATSCGWADRSAGAGFGS